MCWASAKEPRNSTVIAGVCSKTSSRGASDPSARCCSSSTASKALRGGHHAVLRQRSAGAKMPRPQAAHVLDYLPKEDRPQVKSVLRGLGSFRPKKAWHASRNWPHGWISGTLPRPAAWVEAWKSASPSTRLDLPPTLHRCWRQPTSSKATRRSANPDPVVSFTAKTATW